jgi:hypothetical protein
VLAIPLIVPFLRPAVSHPPISYHPCSIDIQIKRDFASAFHDWIHQGDSQKLKKRNDVDAGSSAFGFIRDWKTTTEKKFGLVPKN